MKHRKHDNYSPTSHRASLAGRFHEALLGRVDISTSADDVARLAVTHADALLAQLAIRVEAPDEPQRDAGQDGSEPSEPGSWPM